MKRFIPSFSTILILVLFLFGMANLFTLKVMGGDAAYPAGHYYFYNRFSYQPKIGDWVVFSLPGILGGNCGGSIIGQISPPKVRSEGSQPRYNVFTVPRTECDSRSTGAVDRRSIKGRIYPDREIKLVTKFWNSRAGLFISGWGS